MKTLYTYILQTIIIIYKDLKPSFLVFFFKCFVCNNISHNPSLCILQRHKCWSSHRPIRIQSFSVGAGLMLVWGEGGERWRRAERRRV